jgi:hypothetical protein
MQIIVPTLFETVLRHIEPWLLNAWSRREDFLPLFKRKTPEKVQPYWREWRLMKIRSYLKRHPGKAIELATVWHNQQAHQRAWTNECIRRFGH